MTNLSLATQLFLQLAVILIACQITSYFGKRFLGQSRVVCEMIAGVLLGHSFLGLIFPQLQTFLFPTQALLLVTGKPIPHPSMSILYALSQIGLVLYLFLVGLDFNFSLVQKRLSNVAVVSLIGIITPFTLGITAASTIFNMPGLFPEGISFLTAAFFIGISISVTAFPMLARIIYEHNLSHTSFGALALAAGALDDALVWLLLAAMTAVLKKQIWLFMMPLIGGVIYILFIFFVSRKKFQIFFSPEVQHGISKQKFNYILVFVMLSAWFTDYVGIYSIFGAFLAGLALPKDPLFIKKIKNKLEPLTVKFLLPIFFAYSGLNTQLTEINSMPLLLTTLLIITLAFLGKGAACTLAAKMSGENWSSAAVIGSLMNSRGLMELIVLNIGLENHLITPAFFSILVVMAIVTTLMTSPAFKFFYRHQMKVAIL